MTTELLTMAHTGENEGLEQTQHIPVLMKEVIQYLSPKEGDIIVDGTVGMGGHAAALLERIRKSGRLIGLDRDASALVKAREHLTNHQGEYDLIHKDYRNLDEVLSGLGISGVDGILLDLGVSSFQLNDPERGFGFRQNGPLDMRMDQSAPLTAFTLVNSLSEVEIARILKDYGDERWHARIARAIVRRRAINPIKTTMELTDTVIKALPPYASRQKIHPATRAFQALRIAVNRELEALEAVLELSAKYLKPGGRVAIIAFHSLEDRIVKQKFRQFAKEGILELIVKKPVRPSAEEISFNPRARSARLRAARRTIY